MCCIPGQRYPSTAPMLRRQPVVHVVAQDRGVIRRGDQRRHRLRPIAEALEQILFMALGPRLFAPRFLGHARPVDLAVGEMKSEELRTATPPVDTGSRWYRHSLTRHQAAPDGRTEVGGLSVSE